MPLQYWSCDQYGSQRAAIALDVLPMLEEEARERQRGGQGGVLLPEKIPEANGDARDQAAAILSTNGRYVSDAKRLQQEAPDLLADVRQGKTSLREIIPQGSNGKARELASKGGVSKMKWACDQWQLARKVTPTHRVFNRL